MELQRSFQIIWKIASMMNEIGGLACWKKVNNDDGGDDDDDNDALWRAFVLSYDLRFNSDSRNAVFRGDCLYL
jgi:hypothetical protein